MLWSQKKSVQEVFKKKLYMSCNHLPEKWKGWTILFLSGGRGGGAFFLQKYFFVTKSFGDLRMKFISLVCNIFLCSVLLCTISIFCAKAVQEIFFAFAQPPPSKIKWFVRTGSRDKTVLFESHSFRFAFSIISYRHAAPGGGYTHIHAIWVCAAVKGMVFKLFSLG